MRHRSHTVVMDYCPGKMSFYVQTRDGPHASAERRLGQHPYRDRPARPANFPSAAENDCVRSSRLDTGTRALAHVHAHENVYMFSSSK